MSSPLLLSRPGFAGHETFPFRYGWLRKAIIGAEVSTQFFSQPLALVTLGVGKNMVGSIRHWGLATQILQEVGRGEVAPSERGLLLLNVWDHYLEDAASLWLVHWWLVNNASRAAVWHFAFFHWARQEFTKAELLESLSDWAERQGAKARHTTLERDIDVLLRTYLPSRSAKKSTAEESFDCPLVELGLLRPLHDGERYAFVMGPKRTLPPLLFGYALLDFIERLPGERQSIALQDVLYAPGSPGQAFKLNENAVVEYIESLQEELDGAVELDDTAGLKQVYLRERLDPEHLLQRLYEAEG